MAAFEIVLMLRSSISEAKLDRLIYSFGEKLTAGAGEVLIVEDWGLRALAYKVGTQRRARYIMILAASTYEEVEVAEKFALSQPETLRVMKTPTERTIQNTVDDHVTNDAFDTVDVSVKYRSSGIANEAELEDAVTEFMRSIGYRTVPYSTVSSIDEAAKNSPQIDTVRPGHIRSRTGQ